MSARRHLQPKQFGSADEARTAVENLPEHVDVGSYQQNAYDLGLREEADDNGLAFHTAVYNQAVADHDL